ncbi:MAG: hypothetical protein ABL962_05705, partial [Fimbriimonadaceae bacterium]
MKRRKPTAAIFLGSLFGLSGVVGAQTPFNANGQQNSDDQNQIAGTPTMDMVILKGNQPGVPLRFGSIVPGSESVNFDGRKLVKGKDYQMDYAAGVVYLMRAQKPGQSMTVAYRYEPSKQTAQTGRSSFAATLPTYRFDLTGDGKMTAVVGFGLAERQTDGNVVMSNLYGWQNKAGSLNGLFLMGEREKANVRSAFEYQ